MSVQKDGRGKVYFVSFQKNETKNRKDSGSKQKNASPNRRNQIKEIITKPIDMAKNVPYSRKDKPTQPTIL